MRFFMRIVEAAGDGWRDWLSQPAAELAPFVSHALDLERGVLTGDIGLVSAAQVAAGQQTLRGLLTDDRIEVWRAMRLRLSGLADLDHGAPVGRFWTYRKSLAIAYDAGRTGGLYRLHGRLAGAAIDWPTTLALFESAECEIRALDDAPVTLVAIDQISETGQTIAADVRPDLAGCILRTGSR